MKKVLSIFSVITLMSFQSGAALESPSFTQKSITLANQVLDDSTKVSQSGKGKGRVDSNFTIYYVDFTTSSYYVFVGFSIDFKSGSLLNGIVDGYDGSYRMTGFDVELAVREHKEDISPYPNNTIIGDGGQIDTMAEPFMAPSTTGLTVTKNYTSSFGAESSINREAGTKFGLNGVTGELKIKKNNSVSFEISSSTSYTYNWPYITADRMLNVSDTGVMLVPNNYVEAIWKASNTGAHAFGSAESYDFRGIFGFEISKYGSFGKPCFDLGLQYTMYTSKGNLESKLQFTKVSF